MTDSTALVERVANEVATTVCQDVAELPDRTSLDDWPEAMLVTADELQLIVAREITEALLEIRDDLLTDRAVLDASGEDELVEALNAWLHLFTPTHEGGRDPLVPGWGKAIDDAIDLSRAAIAARTQDEY